MEHFFYDDTFCSDLEDLENQNELQEGNVADLILAALKKARGLQ